MALNHCVIMGRITRDLELKQTQGDVSFINFTVAVDRSFVKQGEERQSDFIDCVAWRQQAEFIAKYFGKGRLIAVEGELQTRNYEDKNGTKHKVTEIVVSNVSFTGEKKGSTSNNVPAGQPPIADSSAANDFAAALTDQGMPF